MKQIYKEVETTICRLCLEPVTNFICTDCLFQNILKWVDLKSKKPTELKLLLSGKNASIKRLLSQSENRSFCVSCKSQVDEIACPCCYLFEMHAAVKSAEPEAAGQFERDFNFDLIFHHGMAQLNLWESIHGRLLSSKAFRPILITDRKRNRDMNTCDECDGVSDDLAEVDGQWICESCRDEGMVIF